MAEGRARNKGTLTGTGVWKLPIPSYIRTRQAVNEEKRGPPLFFVPHL